MILMGKLLLIILYPLLFAQKSLPIYIFIPTSEMLHIAEMVAHDEGFSLRHKSRYFFDEPVPGPHVYPGYYSVAFYWDGYLINDLAINEKTAQVIDVDSCHVFEYRDLKKL
jgi:hypothetical protein